EQGIDRTVVYKAEAADLIAQIAAVRRQEEGYLRAAEHADLRVHITEVRNLDDLRNAFEAGVAARAEETPGPINHVTSVAIERCPADQRNVDSVGSARTEIEIAAALLRRSQRIVQSAHRIRRRYYLQLEIGEPLHLRRRRLYAAPYQSP